MYTVIYSLTCLFVTCASWLLATVAKKGLQSSLDGWLDPERLLSIVAFFGLSFLAFRDYRQWAQERQESQLSGPLSMVNAELSSHLSGDLEMTTAYNFRTISQEEHNESMGSMPQAIPIDESVIPEAQNEDSDDDEEEDASIPDVKGYRDMFIVTILGTLDDMIVFLAAISGTSGSKVRGHEMTRGTISTFFSNATSFSCTRYNCCR